MKVLATLFLLLLTAIHAEEPSDDLLRIIQQASKRSYVDPKFVEAMIRVESNFKPTAVSKKGAVGLLQMMPATADECEIHNRTHVQNHLMGAVECIRKLLNKYSGNLKLTLAAYNAGPNAVARYRGIPPFPETQDYVAKVLRIYRRLRGNS